MECKEQKLNKNDADSRSYYYKDKECLFYTVYYSDSFRKLDIDTDLNVILLDSNFGDKGIKLKYIKDFLPTYTFCCCSSESCVCNFAIRYKSRDPNGIFPWIWCDINNLDDVATPYNTAVILRVLVNNGNTLYHTNDYPCDSQTDKSESNLGGFHFEDLNDSSSHNMFDLLSNLISGDCVESNDQKNDTNLSRLNEKHDIREGLEHIDENQEYHMDDIKKEINDKINKWCRKSDGTYKDIRVLLSSLHNILWEKALWEPVEFSQLMANPELFKKTYRKALILCHPDKHQKEHEEHRYKVHQIFTAINESNKSNT